MLSSFPSVARGSGSSCRLRASRRRACRSRAALRRHGVRERRLAKFRQNVARFRLYRLRFLQENMRFAAFFKIYQILELKFLKFDKSLQILRHLQFFAEISRKVMFVQTDFCENFEIAAVQKDANLVELEKCCRTHIFLQNFVLIQPRTSPPKICKIFEKCIFEKCVFEKCIFRKCIFRKCIFRKCIFQK